MSSIDVGLRRGVCAGVSQSFCLSASMTSVGSQPSIGWVSRARSLEEELGMEQGRLRTLQSTFSHHKDPQRGRAPASLTPDSRNLVQVLLLANSNQDIQKGDSGKWSFHLYQFSITTVTNHHKLKAMPIYQLKVLEVRSPRWVLLAKIKAWVVPDSLWKWV